MPTNQSTPIALRKRNDAFHARAGKRTPLKVQDPLDRKQPIPRWIVWTLLVLLGGGFLFELAQLIFNYISPPPMRVKA
ncbi:hypothetical protein OIO90_005752 [Microbotryomycetes sp. JL221]|nr:hypothetical protein OIO90_005752 [Microbotryomycetes sp. JL221]